MKNLALTTLLLLILNYCQISQKFDEGFFHTVSEKMAGKKLGFSLTQEDIDQLMIKNPRQAFQIIDISSPIPGFNA